MDLCERRNTLERRHPWERSRLKAVRSILRRIPIPEEDRRVLDVGCGDGFITKELAKDERIGSVTGIDIHLSDRQAADMTVSERRIEFKNRYDGLPVHHYNLILMLDLLEHVEDDGRYLLDIVSTYLSDDGYLVVTVPAYPFLFGSHDRFLRHYRRYTRKGLLGVIRSADLLCLSSGYLFLSLLPLRFLSSCYEKYFPSRVGENRGVGCWDRGRILTKALESVLDADVRLTLVFQRAGVTLPGLTVWALCRKQR